MHTGGEPLRVVIEGLPDIAGRTILEKRRYFMEHLDHVRTALMYEPRGHPDMYGAIITPPVSEGSVFGVLFMHNEGYSTMCGHAVIALARLALERGLVSRDQAGRIIMDVPAGTVEAFAMPGEEEVIRSGFVNVPSFVLMEDREVKMEGLGRVRFDIAFGGAFYALVEAPELGLELIPENSALLKKTGQQIKLAIMDQYTIEHPFEKDLGFLYGVIFTGPAHQSTRHSRNVCIFANGQLDRSATGSGVSARAALLYSKGKIELETEIEIESILGTTMQVEITEKTRYGDYAAVIPRVTGKAWYTGESTFVLDPDDPLRNGFIIS